LAVVGWLGYRRRTEMKTMAGVARLARGGGDEGVSEAGVVFEEYDDGVVRGAIVTMEGTVEWITAGSLDEAVQTLTSKYPEYGVLIRHAAESPFDPGESLEEEGDDPLLNWKID
jgi:hypothetical protein